MARTSKSKSPAEKSKSAGPAQKPRQPRTPASPKTTNNTARAASTADVEASSGQARSTQDTATEGERRVRLDTSTMKSSYCNVCNATSTREEVVLNFGLNQSWDRPQGDLEIQIQHRIIMSPHAAKKLQGILGSLLSEYESRHGKLEQ